MGSYKLIISTTVDALISTRPLGVCAVVLFQYDRHCHPVFFWRCLLIERWFPINPALSIVHVPLVQDQNAEICKPNA